MRPVSPVKANPGVHSTPIRHASGSSQVIKPSIEIARIRRRQPVFSDGSSDTEYSSSSGEDDAHENGNCVESKPEDEPRSQDEHIRASTSAALPSKSHIKMENLQQGSPFGISSLTGGVVNGQTASAHPSISIPKVGIKPTPLKERHEVKDGKTIVVVDLDDSDEEETSPLCTKCRHGMEHKQPELQVSKAAGNEEVITPKVTLVVDLSGTSSSQVNHAPITLGVLPKSGTPLVATTPASSKACGTQVGAPINFSREIMKSNGNQSDSSTEQINAVASKSSRKQTETKVETSRENVQTVFLKSNEKQTETRVETSRTVFLTSNGKQTERKAETSKTVFLKTNGKQSESKVEIRREHIKTVLPAGDESEDEASTLSEDYRRGLADGHHVEAIRPDWSLDVICDLCERGPSLSLGAWYSWCCGNPSTICTCPNEEQQRRKKQLMSKGGKSWRAGNPPYPWSGKVHKLCGLWSAEVFEDANQPYRIMNLFTAVQRSKKSKCSDPDCGLFGATLGCRVASCKKNFHYPCADKLSVTVKVRMWDGLMKPIACKDHRDVNDVLDDVKAQKEKKEIQKKRKRGKKTLLPSTGASGSSSKLEVRPSGGDVIDIESSGEEDSPHKPSVHEVLNGLKTPNISSSRLSLTKMIDASDSCPGACESGPKYYGKNLLCADFAGGLEPISVPCTNDVDTEPPPYLEYITKSRYQGHPLGSRKQLHSLLEREAKACDGCARHDPDDPFAPVSVHIPFERREDDFREDWLRERMYGRLPYDKYARLVIGTDYNELVECNDRCKCGDSCINREMQKGLRTPIELYKTKNKGWAVRTLVPIPRGRFVIEYVGEMLTQDQAQRYGQIYDEIKRSYLYDLDYPESKRMPDFTLDGFHASNVARFINHSCDANLKIYRVYVETTYKWLSHIGMYAMRDIEAGEELSYDYNYGRHDLQVHDGNSNNPEAGKQKMVLGNDSSTHIKCHCGAKNCREWLWRPMHVGDDESEDE